MGDVQLLGFRPFRLNQAFEPFCLIRGNERCAPNGGSHLPAKLLFDVGDEPAANAIAHRTEALIRGILPKLNPVCLHI
jgi:hypothetical protein